MTNKLLTAVLAVLSVQVLITGYGAVAGQEEAHATCAHDHGTVLHHQCVRAGRVLFGIPL